MGGWVGGMSCLSGGWLGGMGSCLISLNLVISVLLIDEPPTHLPIQTSTYSSARLAMYGLCRT